MKNVNNIRIGRDVHGDVNIQSTVSHDILSATQVAAFKQTVDKILSCLEEVGVDRREYDDVEAVLSEIELVTSSNEPLTRGKARRILDAAAQCANGVASEIIASALIHSLPFLN